MPVYITCQRNRIDGLDCSKTSKGFVVCEGDSASAIYKEGLVLCTSCGKAVQEITERSQFVTIAELAEMMTEEERGVQTVEEKPMATLHDLAERFNQAKVDVPKAEKAPQPQAAPKTEEAPKAQEDTLGSMPSHVHGPRIAAQVEALRAAAATLRQGAEGLRTQAASNPLLATALGGAIKQMEREAQTKEKDATRLLEEATRKAKEPLSQFHQAASLRVALLQRGGSAALSAVEQLITVGVLSVKNGTLVVKKLGESKGEAETPATPAPRQRHASGEQAPRRSSSTPDPDKVRLAMRAHQLRGEGFTLAQIAEKLGIDDPAYKGLRVVQRLLTLKVA